MEQVETFEEREETRESGINVGPKERSASLLSGASLAAYGINNLLRKNYVRGALMAAAGGYLVYRGQTGRCQLYRALGVNTNGKSEVGVELEEKIKVDRPREEVYHYWRNLEHMPRFMKHIQSVTAAGENRYHWVAETPGKIRIEWDSEVTEDRPNELIRWRSIPGSQVHNEGQVTFRQEPGEYGTEVILEMTYHPPGGTAGSSIAQMFNFVTSRFLRKELKRFKKLMETGRVPELEGRSATTF